jgi:CRP-like cAMP-binding protein
MTTEGITPRKLEILVVERDLRAGSEICDAVRECGFSVAGAVSCLDRGLEVLDLRRVDGAIVDVNLDDAVSSPLCAELARRQVPYCFLNGRNGAAIPADVRHTPVIAKRCDAAQLKSALDTMMRTPPVPVPATRGNRLLNGLADADRATIDPLLQSVRLRRGQVLQADTTPEGRVIFPMTAVISLDVEANGRRIQAALVGPEGIVGAEVLFGVHAATRAVVLFEGDAWCAGVDDVARLVAANPALRSRLLESVNGLVVQVSRTLLATGHGTIEQRVARFLLMAAARIDATEIPITHSALADALGVRRAGVTVALHVLEGRQAVRSERKRVRILERAVLAEAAGGFYGSE